MSKFTEVNVGKEYYPKYKDSLTYLEFKEIESCLSDCVVDICWDNIEGLMLPYGMGAFVLVGKSFKKMYTNEAQVDFTDWKKKVIEKTQRRSVPYFKYINPHTRDKSKRYLMYWKFKGKQALLRSIVKRDFETRNIKRQVFDMPDQFYNFSRKAVNHAKKYEKERNYFKT